MDLQTIAIYAHASEKEKVRNVRGQGELVESGHETATLTFDLIGVET
jgi:hypothetical protein